MHLQISAPKSMIILHLQHTFWIRRIVHLGLEFRSLPVTAAAMTTFYFVSSLTWNANNASADEKQRNFPLPT
jgi:hypothetical protein